MSHFTALYGIVQVSEAMEDWCGGVERRLWELHFGLIRQMQHHQVGNTFFL